MLIEDISGCALFLDLDGTLIDIGRRPDGVVVPSGLAQLLLRLSAGLRGALAINSGRPIADIDRFLAPLTPIAAGVHGAELRLAAGGEVHHLAKSLEPSLVDAVYELCQVDDGVSVELKGFSIAVHYRMAPEAGPKIEAALRHILEGGPDHLILSRGRKVFEILPRHISKGAALESVLALPGFCGRRPIMVGDDASDETALDAARRLGGLGLRVAGEYFPQELADFEGPANVRSWLLALAERLEADVVSKG